MANPCAIARNRRPSCSAKRRRSTAFRRGGACALAALALLVLMPVASAQGQELSNRPAALELPGFAEPDQLVDAEQWVGPEGLSTTLQIMLVLTVLSLAPALLIMTTCFVRIVVVLALLRQALGTAQLPPNQVLTSLALFLTFLVMTPVWQQVYQDAVEPYTARQIGAEEAWSRGTAPLRRFMSRQIEQAGNADDVWLMLGAMPEQSEPTTYDEVPLQALSAAFLLSELKTAFLIGFQLYLPFLIIDMVVSSVLLSMGMLMLPPVLISLPFKLLLFVLVDGWHLVVDMLLGSVAM